MKLLISTLLLSITYQSIVCADPELENEEFEARSFLQYLDERAAARNKKSTLVSWNYNSNLTNENLQHLLDVTTQVAKEEKEDWEELNKFHWKTYKDEDLRRQFKTYSLLGAAALPDNKFRKNQKIISGMEKVYSTVNLCSYDNSSKCDLNLEPELTEIFGTSRNADELKYYWVEWRNAIGPKLKHKYKEYVDFQNEIARLNNFVDNTELWLDDFESDDFRDQLNNLWEELKPLYLQIHAYVRYKLREIYGDVVSERGPIPAHLLGNMWAQTWSYVANFTLPYPEKESVDVTSAMLEQDYTPLKMFELAENFFVSLNLSAMPSKFWERSILEKPQDGRELVCHASAWDFYGDDDVRIKQCTRVNEEDLYTAHHEMGHIEYYLQYSHQPSVYRQGANSGFHEAVGDVISLSVSTTKHLHKIGLLKDPTTDNEILLNNLYRTGLDKIVFLPFGYLMDLWRWDVFSGKTSYDNWNCKWWQLRQHYQGVEPPVNRSEEDFDPAAKYHIVADVPYIRYFVSFVIQFQFHRALCLKAGQYEPENPSKPLYDCDIYQNTAAGNALRNMLKLGSSRPWPDAMEVLTGQRYMDASGLLEYFKPLTKWLEEKNKKNNVYIGWEPTDKVCSSTEKETSSDSD